MLTQCPLEKKSDFSEEMHIFSMQEEVNSFETSLIFTISTLRVKKKPLQ